MIVTLPKIQTFMNISDIIALVGTVGGIQGLVEAEKGWQPENSTGAKKKLE